VGLVFEASGFGALFSLIIGWNLEQNVFVYLGLFDFAFGLLLRAMLSFAAAILIMLILF